MNRSVSYLLCQIGFLVILGCLLSCTQAIADSSYPLTLIYSGEEQGLLGLHGCGAEQVGGLARRHTIIESLRAEHPHALNLHTGNTLDSANPNNELIYQIALEALSGMNYDALCLGPRDLSLPTDTLSTLYGNHPDLPVICTNLSVSSPTLFSPYIIHNTTAQIKVTVINLISKSYQTEISAYNSSVTLTDPAEALETLSKEIIEESEVVVGVFHGEEDEARTLAEKFSWLSVLVRAHNESTKVASDTPTVIGKTTIVTNPAKGEAVGVLQVGLDPNRQMISRQHQRVTVSGNHVLSSIRRRYSGFAK